MSGASSKVPAAAVASPGFRLTGRSPVGDAMPWRDWWKDQHADFVGMRARARIDAQNAAAVVLTLRTGRSTMRFLAEGLVELPPLPGAQEMLLSKEQMLDVVQRIFAGNTQDCGV